LGALVHVADARTQARAEVAAHIHHVDIIIATTEIPGQRPPMLVPARAISVMRPGSVIVDTTASVLGGTVELAEPDATVVVEPGITIIGDDNLASKTPTSASTAYATSVAALLGHLVRDGALSIDLADPIQAEVVVAHDRSVVSDAVWQLILDEISLAGLP
jgi:NAD(P) transhydrogenase subunit alpha